MRSGFISSAPLALSVILVVLPAEAIAQNGPGPGGDIDLQSFRPAMDSRGYITLNSAQVLAPGDLSFGLVTNWGRGVLRFERDDQSYEVRHLLTPTLVAAIGARLAGLDLELGASLPFGVMAGGRSPETLFPEPNQNLTHRFDGQGLGDVGLHLKWRLLDPERRPVGLALVGSLYLPTAQPGRWLGSGALTPQGGVVVERIAGRVKLAANAGFRLRSGGVAEFRDDMPLRPDGQPQPMTGESIAVGSTIPFGGAAAYEVAPGRFDVLIELFGAAPLAGENYFPLEGLAGIKVYLAESSFLSLGGGTGFLPGRGNPDLRAFLGIVFEPRVGRPEAGRIPHVVGFCPDGTPDIDGCPEPEDDGDRVAEELDPCDEDSYDEDRCPRRNLEVEFESDAVVLQEIHFEFDSAEIKPESFPILRAVAHALEVHENIFLVEVQGHTDQRGSDRYNLGLSQRRAESVVDFLVREGISRSRLQARGHGKRRPIDKRMNEEAWAKNRRVEFVILERW